MKKKLFLTIILFITILSSAKAERMRLAIMDFQAKDLPKSTAERASDWLRTEMINTNNFIVIERSAMKEIFKEQAFSMTGCTDTSCAVKIGKLLSAKKILIGSIEKWRKKIILNGRIIDVEKGIAEFAQKETVSSLDDLDKAVNLFAQNLDRRIQGLEVKQKKSEAVYQPKKYYPAPGKNNIFGGTWKTNYGPVHITGSADTVIGYYYNGKATIRGAITGNKLNFTWRESSTFSGNGYFILSRDGNSFHGGWGVGSQSPTSNWSGVRIK
jgi:TolB-like protein